MKNVFCDALRSCSMFYTQSKDTLAGFLLRLKDMKVVWKRHFVCILLGFSQNFRGNLYYEPLSQFVLK